MSTLNTIPFTAAGNLTADPELRFTGTGKPVAGLRIAVTPPHLQGGAVGGGVAVVPLVLGAAQRG